jgi:hypothetical protein
MAKIVPRISTQKKEMALAALSAIGSLIVSLARIAHPRGYATINLVLIYGTEGISTDSKKQKIFKLVYKRIHF